MSLQVLQLRTRQLHRRPREEPLAAELPFPHARPRSRIQSPHVLAAEDEVSDSLGPRCPYDADDATGLIADLNSKIRRDVQVSRRVERHAIGPRTQRRPPLDLIRKFKMMERLSIREAAIRL